MLHNRRGAPSGNRNRLKHGRYSAAAVARRKLVRNNVRSARLALLEATGELQFDRLQRLRDTPAQESP